MNYRRLGKTGLNVSEIGFGGEWLSRHPEEESVELIRYAGQKGINIISVAIDAPQDVISALSGKIGRLAGISAKTAYSGVITKADSNASN